MTKEKTAVELPEEELPEEELPEEERTAVEYPTSKGDVVTARDCVYGSKYSKGAVVDMADGSQYECTGDKDGSWKKLKKEKTPS